MPNGTISTSTINQENVEYIKDEMEYSSEEEIDEIDMNGYQKEVLEKDNWIQTN